jgi:hypothetical protein
VLSLKGEIDLHVSPSVTASLNQMIEKKPERLVVGRSDSGQHCSLNKWIQTALPNSKNALNFSSALTIKRFPSPRCASVIQSVRPLKSMAETQPQFNRLC